MKKFTFNSLGITLLSLIFSIVFVANTYGQTATNTSSHHIIYVNQSSYGTPDGSSWNSAYSDLQQALEIAMPGDSIFVATGNYIPTKDVNNQIPSDPRSATFVIPKKVSVFGSFDPYASQNGGDIWSSRDVMNNSSVLYGDYNYTTSDTDNVYNVVVMSDSSYIDGFKITKGYANGSQSNINNMGPAIYIGQKTNVTVSNCFIKNNYGSQSGGIAVYFCNSPINITNCIFEADSTANGGGAIGMWDAAPYISNCFFYLNKAANFGSAIYNWGSGSTSKIVNCDFFGNMAYGPTDNGVIHDRGVSSTVVNCILWNNIGNDIDGSNGGGANVSYSDVQQSGFAGSNGNISSDPLVQLDGEGSGGPVTSSNSPCIDAGTSNLAPEFDIGGNIRVDIPTVANTGAGSPNYVDMGFSEYIQDVAVINWAGTRNLCDLSNNFQVAITLINNSDDTLVNIPVFYSYDGATPVQGTVASINPKTTVDYFFTQTINAAIVGHHKITMYCDYMGDGNKANDTLTITWTYASPISKFPFVENFEDHKLDGFITNENTGTDLYVGVDTAIGVNDTWGLEIHGSPTYNYNWNNPQNNEQIFQNQQYLTKLMNCTIDASLLSNVNLSFDFKQRRSWNIYNCAFRVMINDTVYAKSLQGDTVWRVGTDNVENGYQNLLFDLSAYAGTTFKLSLEAVTKVYQPGYDEDFVRIDNIRLWERPAVDVGIKNIYGSSSCGDCGCTQDSLYAEIGNYGMQGVSNIPVTAQINTPDTIYSYSVVYADTIQPMQSKSLFLGSFSSAPYGTYHISVKTLMAGDTVITDNDSVVFIGKKDKFGIPYLENFSTNPLRWSFSGCSIQDFPLTGGSEKKAIAFISQSANGDPSYQLDNNFLESDNPFGLITNKSVFVFDYYINSSLGGDTLVVYTSTDCKETWQIAGDFTAGDLQISGSGYHRITYSNSSLVGKNVFVKFVVKGPHTSNFFLYLDNIGVLNSIAFNLADSYTICGGSTQELNTHQPNSYNQEWKKLGTPGVISTDSMIVVSTSGIYVATVSDSYGSVFSDTVRITVLPEPAASFITSNQSVCMGDSVDVGIVFSGAPPYYYNIQFNEGFSHDSLLNSNFTISKRLFNVNTQLIISEISDTMGCVYTHNFDTMNIVVNPLPNVSINGLSSSYCANDTAVVVNAVPIGGVLIGQGIVGDKLYPQFATQGVDSILYHYVDANGCGNSDTVVVNINSAPAVHFNTILNTDYCSNADSIILSAVPGGGIFAGSGVVGDIFYPSQSNAGNVTLSYLYSAPNGCSATDTLNTAVHTIPSVSWNAQSDVCANSTPVTLQGGTPSGGVYSGIAVAQGNFYPSIAGAGSFPLTYQYVDAFGCANSVTESIIVNSVPDAAFSLPASICINDTADVVYTASNYYATMSWDFDGANVISGSGQGPYSIDWDVPGLKVVSLVTTENTCSSDTVYKMINVMPSIAMITSVGSTDACYGDSVTLFANSGIGYSYQWFNTNGILNNDTLPYFNANQSGAYYCRVTPANACAGFSDTIVVNIRPQIIADFNMPAEACSGDMVAVSFLGTAPANAVYNWNFDAGIIASGSGLGPFNIIWNMDSIQTVSLVVSDDRCSSDPKMKNINIYSTPALITALGSTSFCDGGSVSLSANSGNYSYQWFKNGVPNSTAAINTVSSAGNYTVRVTDNARGCSNLSDTMAVVVNTTNFNIDFSADHTSFNIPPFNTNFTNHTVDVNNYYWMWNFGDGNTSTYINPAHQYMYDGTYTVGVIAQNISTGCFDTLVKTDYISCSGGSANPCSLDAGFGNIGGNEVCPNDSVKLFAHDHTSGINYQWLKDGILIAGASDSVYYAKLTGLYQLMVSNVSCSTFSQPFSLTQRTTVTPTLLSNGQIQPCSNDSMELYVSTSFLNYQWNTGSSAPSIYVKNSGSFIVTVTDNNGCQSASAPYVVNASLLQVPNICIVGVDTATNHNRVVWERQANNLIDSFRVYRESNVAGVYSLIGSQPFSDLSVFEDTNSNPAQQAYRYRITAVDTCGMETAPSPIHKTLHLTVNAGLGGVWNLIWTHYEGFNFGSYRIYRSSDSTNMQLLTQIQSNLTSYTDLNPPSGDVYYQIEVMSPHPCYPDSILAKANTNYNYSRSNTANSGMARNTGFITSRNKQLSMQLYPNPNKGNFILEIRSKNRRAQNYKLEIYSTMGKLMHSENISNVLKVDKTMHFETWSKGVYIIKLTSNQQVLTSRFILE